LPEYLPSFFHHIHIRFAIYGRILDHIKLFTHITPL